MTNKDIFNIAVQQSAYDSSCDSKDFLSGENKIVVSTQHPKARNYLSLPFLCDLTTYGHNIVASVSQEVIAPVSEYISKYNCVSCFETPNLLALSKMLKPYDMDVCFMAEYFLPDISLLNTLDCKYETKLLFPCDFANLYLPEWGNALSNKSKRHLDTLAVGAFDKGKLIGLAGCSAECDTMWEIGIDVLPEYRMQGIASALTSRLAQEILSRGIVPFYCCAWSNLGSARNAIKSGFRPAWVQLTVKSRQFIDEMI